MRCLISVSVLVVSTAPEQLPIHLTVQRSFSMTSLHTAGASHFKQQTVTDRDFRITNHAQVYIMFGMIRTASLLQNIVVRQTMCSAVTIRGVIKITFHYTSRVNYLFTVEELTYYFHKSSFSAFSRLCSLHSKPVLFTSEYCNLQSNSVAQWARNFLFTCLVKYP